MKISNLLDWYSIKARLIPAIIVLVASYLIFRPEINLDFLPDNINKYLWLSAILVVIWYILSETIRHMWKLLETIVYCNGKKMPTSLFLLWKKDLFEKDLAKKIKDKIKEDFDINRRSNNNSRVKDIVGLVRRKVWNWQLLLTYNTRYWFFRNLLWWLIFLELVVIAYSIFIKNIILNNINIWVIVIIVIWIIWMRMSAHEYAKNLFTEYHTLDKE